MEKTEKKSKKQITAEERLKNSKVLFMRGKLGNAIFVNTETSEAFNKLQISEWSVEKLRAMADYMEAFPNCTLFPDGSGKLCK